MAAAALTVANLKELLPAEEGQHGGRFQDGEFGDHGGDQILPTVSVFVNSRNNLNLILNTLSEVDTWTWTSRSIRCQDFWDARAFDLYPICHLLCHTISSS